MATRFCGEHPKDVAPWFNLRHAERLFGPSGPSQPRDHGSKIRITWSHHRPYGFTETKFASAGKSSSHTRSALLRPTLRSIDVDRQASAYNKGYVVFFGNSCFGNSTGGAIEITNVKYLKMLKYLIVPISQEHVFYRKPGPSRGHDFIFLANFDKG
ncbi:uncharacterized protein PGTG_16011 [Puccinia graminis f. sp. tritici CRL 75-36-700-3]|uniref:Uncharacterized protein n=1 Tax=Puccinia graminis f. sp. tritici (strain CRL 75-36-700-3 / race SCCL) TaxID=418459 RepID=E3L1J9_PUCGT|nr:uncharacterized protein PGTG_16011 [Puccinia graminis f. sp. tritici CRL 75-36-700-3]EFP90424.2 hypothetical protein PGTG_16011 [Puccinia graminis f. sp. tritici CRL 75-36-700-3]